MQPDAIAPLHRLARVAAHLNPQVRYVPRLASPATANLLPTVETET